LRIVVWLCLIACSVAVAVGLLVLWTSAFGLLSNQAPVEVLALGCVVEALGVLLIGLVLLDGLQKPGAEGEL
jgi:hypothetical protein